MTLIQIRKETKYSKSLLPGDLTPIHVAMQLFHHCGTVKPQTKSM